MASEPKANRSEEGYVHEYDSPVTKKVMGGRNVNNTAAFFIPYLKSGFRVLDIGCGQGTITVGLAQIVHPGEVVGIDIEHSQVEASRNVAADHGVENTRFSVGSAYELDFKDETFDAVFSSALLEHLSRPVDVLREVYRVLRPGGIAGIRSCDFGGWITFPTVPVLTEMRELYLRFRQHSGGDPFVGRKLKMLLGQAGFSKIEAAGTCTSARIDDAKTRSEAPLREFAGGRFREEAIRLGWADASFFGQVETALKERNESPYIFHALVRCEALGWKMTSDQP